MRVLRDTMTTMKNSGDGVLVEGALLKCSHGSETGELKAENRHGCIVTGKVLINEEDARYDENIPNFGECKIRCGPCKPEIIDERWLSTESRWLVDGKPAVTTVACCLCAEGGLIHPETTGQEDVFGALLEQMDEAWRFFGLENGLFSGDPININTGNFVTQKTDLQISGSLPLLFTRTYNAMDKRSGAMGKGWRHNYEAHLNDKDDSIEVTWEDGRGEIFNATRAGRYVSGKSYISKSSHMSYELTCESGSIYSFDKDGRCVGIRDLAGNRTLFGYAENNLKSVENVSGSFTFEHDKQDRVTSVTDMTGRTVRYSYDEFGTLSAVEDVLGVKTEYLYDKHDRMLAPVKVSGEPSIINEYDKKSRVTKQHFADGGVMQFEYDENWDRTTLT